jgi:Na+/H+-dicarboxylate symporter
MTTTFLRFVNLILAALLAGTSFGIWMGLNPNNYSPATYLEQQQHLVRSLNTLMVTLVIAATVVTIISAFLHRNNKTVFVTLLVASAFFASCIFISRFGNLPIQSEMLNWKIDSLPDNWISLRDKWWTFHIVRTIAELIALALVSWTSSKTAIYTSNEK